MKILFICDWDFTFLWEKVAHNLKAQGLLDEALALVIGRNFKDHLDRSQSNPFAREWLLQDEVPIDISDAPPDLNRLKNLEKEYANPTLWRYLWADRALIHGSFNKSCNRLIKAFDFYESLYSCEQPNLIIAPGYGSMPHLVGHFVARRKGIPMLKPMHTRLGDRYVPGYDVLEKFDFGNQSEQPNCEFEVEEFLSVFRNRPERPSYESVNDRMHGVDWGHFFRFFRYAYRYWITGVYAKDHSKPNPIKKIWLEAKPKVQRQLLKKANIWDKYNPSIDYVYFPLHFQPEASTMSLAPFYLDQPSIIENLAKSVPSGYRIIVKEHPQMLGRRPREYYECLKSISNVVVVPPFTDNFKVIQNAKLIFTITGTAGMEGVILGKPVITLGSVIYNQCGLVTQAGDVAPTGWAVLIRELLLNYRHNEERLRLYLKQLFANSTRFWFMEPHSAPDEVLSDGNVEIIANWISIELQKLSASKSYGRPSFHPQPTLWKLATTEPDSGSVQG